MAKFFCLLVIIFCSFQLYSQSDSIKIKSQNLYGTFGTFGIGGALSVNYENHFVNKPNLKFGPKLSLGTVIIGDYDGGGSQDVYFSPSACLLLGSENLKRSVFFEANIGLIFLELEDTNIDDYPYSFIGARFVKHKNSRVFRIGVGIPEFLQISFGKNF